MRKKILLILPLLLFAITQQLQAVTCNWGYCNSVVNDQFGSVNKGKGAIYIPAEISKMYEGKQLSYVRVGLAAKAKTVKVFVTKDLNGEYIATRTQRDQLSGFNEIKFAEPWTIDGEGFYIGYEFESDDYALGSSTMYNENGCSLLRLASLSTSTSPSATWAPPSDAASRWPIASTVARR